MIPDRCVVHLGHEATHRLKVARRQSPHTLKLQLAITTGRGVVSDQEATSRETKSFSKAMLEWGQAQTAEVKDVTDRLAWLEYKQAEVHAEYARSLEQSRSALKDLRCASVSFKESCVTHHNACLL